MAGKSTFMRQVALNQILFQMGSFVPATSANLSIVDRVFTRIGSGDNLTQGESTFFVEMKETATILNDRTEDSLILLDEVGRGTSTYDGLSLAWAIIESLIQNKPTSKTLFATHYHELTDLEKYPGIFNLYLDTLEKEGNILFLKKVKKGKVKKSFGIYVAKLAGIPDSVLSRASELLTAMESQKKGVKLKWNEPSLFSMDQKPEPNLEIPDSVQKILDELKKLNIEDTTPLEAISILNQLRIWSKEKDQSR
jgi:DNA mismatch repair protein MutS